MRPGGASRVSRSASSTAGSCVKPASMTCSSRPSCSIRARVDARIRVAEQVDPPRADGIEIPAAVVLVQPDARATRDRQHRQPLVVLHLRARMPDDAQVAFCERMQREAAGERAAWPRSLKQAVGARAATRHHLRMRIRAFTSSLTGTAIDRARGLLAGARQVPSPNCDDRPPAYAGRSHHRPWHQPAARRVRRSLDRPACLPMRCHPAAHPYFDQVRDLRVSSHLLIRRDGEVVQYVPFQRRAWHAGASYVGAAASAATTIRSVSNSKAPTIPLRADAICDARTGDRTAVPVLSRHYARAHRGPQRRGARAQVGPRHRIRLAVAAHAGAL